MAKKKENKKTEKVTEETKTSKKVEEVKVDKVVEKPKKEVKTQPKKQEEVKKSLLQLIEESDIRYSFILGALNYANLLNVLNEEEKNKKNGLFIKPLMTNSEFDKIINNFLNRRN